MFQVGSNTECAIAFALNTVRKQLSHEAVLDLIKAYDCVPRELLQKMLDERLPPNLSIMLRPLLWPLRLKAKQQMSDVTFVTVTGTPKGDPPIPVLFTLIMESYIRCVKRSPYRGIVSLFVDNVLMLSSSLASMREMLQESVAWARSVQMISVVAKSCGIELTRNSHPEHRTPPIEVTCRITRCITRANGTD